MIRPAAQLRMPQFHYGKSDASTRRMKPRSWPTTSPRAIGPSSPIRRSPSRIASYLAERNKAHPDYLAAGWLMMTNKASPCLQCHAIGQFKPSGGDQVVNGPDLREVAPGSGPTISRPGSPTRAGWCRTRRCPRTSHRMERSRSWCPRRSRINRSRWSRRFGTRSSTMSTPSSSSSPAARSRRDTAGIAPQDFGKCPVV